MGLWHSRLCVPLSFLLLLIVESYSAADIFRWDTGVHRAFIFSALLSVLRGSFGFTAEIAEMRGG